MSFDPNDYYNDSYNMDENMRLDDTDGKNNGKGMAIASMILGILALVTCICYCPAIPFALISIILAIIVLAKRKNGKPFAITGIVTSAIAVVVSVVVLVLSGSVMENISDLLENSDAYTQQYKEDGTIPESVLDMFGGDKELAKQFMDGFSGSANDVNNE